MRSRAFTLTEMLFIIGMLSVAGLLLTRLFTASQKIIDQAPAAQDRQASLEHLCQSLRRDVWAARQIELPEEQTIVLGVGDARVTWTCKDGIPTRKAADVEQRWTATLKFAATSSAGGVVIFFPEPDETRRFTSQVLAMRKGAP